MEGNRHYGARARGRFTPVVQGGLALLVAGTLVTFSFLAFRTGFAEQPRGGITAVESDRTDRRPVLLPSPGERAPREEVRSVIELAGEETTVVAQDATGERVLGTRLRDRSGEGEVVTDATARHSLSSGATSDYEPEDDKGHNAPKNARHDKGRSKAARRTRASGHKNGHHRGKGRAGGHRRHHG